MALEHDENRGAERDQRVGPQSGKALAPLPLEANGAAEQNGDDQVERVVPERGINLGGIDSSLTLNDLRGGHTRESVPGRKKIGREPPRIVRALAAPRDSRMTGACW